MEKTNGLIAILPYTKFKWGCEVQYRQSLYTREEAILYASQHDCNVIVKYEKRTGPLFDVLQDPNTVFTAEDSFETVEPIPVSQLEPESTGWSKFMLGRLAGLVKWHGAASSTSQPEKAVS